MRYFVLGALSGALALFSFQNFVSHDKISAIKIAAENYGARLGVDVALLVESSSGGIVSGSEPTIVFFGYGDNLLECERLAGIFNELSSLTEASCEVL